MRPATLFELHRGGVPEVRVRGWLRHYRDGKCLLALGGDDAFPMRSLLKPVQFLAGLGAQFIDRVPERWVPGLGSPSGTPAQTRCLERWFENAEFDLHRAALKLKPTLPFDADAQGVARLEGAVPRPEWNSCYVKHLAILEACHRHGWDTATYCGKSHPFHARVSGILGEALGKVPETFVIDGCRLPTPVLTPDDMARLFVHLLGEKAPAAKAAWAAMQQFPEWIGGPNRLDTEIMKRNPKVIAKEGSDGLLVVARDNEAVVVKLEAGYRLSHLATALALASGPMGLDVPAYEYPGQQIVRLEGN